jgi:SMP-30/gluconolaconase/LRE-like protein
VIGKALSMIAALLATMAVNAAASDLDEFKVKRQAVYEFTQAPKVTRNGDRIAIAFTSKGYCDATVAIEDADGRIIRHLASGVLGKNAPPPFQKDSLKQSIVWDGKDDQGTYIDDKDAYTVRVSLGLKPQFERTLLWSPHKQRGGLPIMAPAPEGVYVFDGTGVDHIRLFDHDGNYVRTIYPFPADKLKKVEGLKWHKFPQGYSWPLKESGYQQTLLTSGVNDNIHDQGSARHGVAAMGMAVRGGQIALAWEHLNRLATDGSSGGLPLKGPGTGFTINRGGYGGFGRGKFTIGPTSLAFSPDAKTLYMSGYLWRQRSGHSGCYHVVMKLDFEKGKKAEIFVGSTKVNGFGKDSKHFAVPTSVACDAKGRVYVSDFLNNRVQIFDPSGKLLKSIPVDRPTKVMVHQKTGEIFICSWVPIGIPGDAWRAYKYDAKKIKNTIARFSPFPALKRTSFEPFPLGPAGHGRVFQAGQLHHVELDSWAPGKDPVFWINSRKFVATRADHRILYIDHSKVMAHGTWARGIKVVRQEGGRWKVLSSFGTRAVKKVKRVRPIAHNIQHCFVNPSNGKLYVGEADSGATVKAFNRLIEIDPGTGKIRSIPLPFNALDIAFDLNNLIYLRTTDVVARYNFDTWREVPWDYGEQLGRVSSGMGGKATSAISAVVMPSVSPVCFHQSGMSVSARGNLAVACSNRPKGKSVHHDFEIFGKASQYGKAYRPSMYPGREESSTSCSVHIWDKRGKLIHEDAIWGLPQLDGMHLDRDNNIYVMAAPTRVLDGKRYFNYMSETLMKFAPKKGKIINAGKRGPLPLTDAARPKRKLELSGRWANGAQWFYGGVGFAGFNTPYSGGGCACWFARFWLDYYARSFATELNQFSVAVVDSNGNLITRIGKYGNVDDGMPLIKTGGRGLRAAKPLQNAGRRSTRSLSGEPPNQRSIGGDEVSLFHATFVGTHTDHRLFIADLGNARILSVKLGYHATRKIKLEDVPNK